MALAVPTHYEYSQRVDSIGAHYDWDCDIDAGKLSCTDNPVSHLTYVRLAPDAPMYLVLRFIDRQHDAFARRSGVATRVCCGPVNFCAAENMLTPACQPCISSGL